MRNRQKLDILFVSKQKLIGFHFAFSEGMPKGRSSEYTFNF